MFQALIAVLAVASLSQTAPVTSPASAPASAPAASFVRPIDLAEVNRRVRALPARERELVGMYLEAARRTVLDVTDGCYPDTGYKIHVRNLAERAKGAAVLSSLTDYWPEDFRRYCRKETVALLKEVGAEFRKDPNFRYAWQAAFWASEAGIAAWFLWDDLDPDLRQTLAEMVAFQADRFIDVRPKTCFKENTEAETVSWNSAILTLAVNMMPDHPHHAAWDRAAKTYLYNTFSVSRDLADETIGDDGLPVKQWVVGPNVFDDFTLENHKMFHLSYVFASFRYHIQGYALYGLAGRQPPLAFRHHARDMYERVMQPCMSREGFIVFVPDNDWKLYHDWTEDCVVHAYMAFLERDPLAAGLEERALRNVTRYWRSFPKGFAYDRPYGCGKPRTSRIADVVLMHAMSPARPPDPMGEAEIDRKLTGTFGLPSADLLTHTDRSGVFSSYCRGKAREIVRFVGPSHETWLTLPLLANYRGQLGEKKPIVRSLRVKSARGEDWFWAVRQDEAPGAADAFVSLPGGLVVHIERAPAGLLPADASVENSVGIEKSYRKITACYQGGCADWEYGTAEWRHANGSRELSVPGNWLNIDARFGLVFLTPKGAAVPALSLPKPGARDAVRARTAVPADRAHILAIVACPDYKPDETGALAADSRIEQVGDCLRCTIGSRVVLFNFGFAPSRVASPEADGREVELPAGGVGVWLDGHRLAL